MTELSGRPIGPVSSERTEPLDDGWDVRATITLDAEQFGPEALQGLDAFSHVEVVSVFDRVDPDGVPTVARHPRGNPDWPQVGIFAQRATGREPSRRLGVPTAGRAGPDSLGSRARRDRRHTDPGPHAVRGGVRPPGQLHQPARSRELMAAYSIQRNHLRLLTSTPSRLAWSTCAVKSRIASGRASGASRAT